MAKKLEKRFQKQKKEKMAKAKKTTEMAMIKKMVMKKVVLKVKQLEMVRVRLAKSRPRSHQSLPLSQGSKTRETSSSSRIITTQMQTQSLSQT